MDKLGVGIVGTGWVAGEHVRAFVQNPHTEVVAICGRDRSKAQGLAQRCGVDCAVFDVYEEMLNLANVHIVCIATPPQVHCAQAVAAAEAGKHLYLEKAMATTLEDCAKIRDAVKKAKVKSVVNFVLRWNPLFDIIKAQLNDGAIGTPFLGEVDYFHGIGPQYGQFAWNIKKDKGVSSLLSAGCHALDALRYFMGGEVAEVYQYATRGGNPDFAPYEYAPTSCTMLRFADGRIGKVVSCIEAIQPYVFNINLVGDSGSIKNNLIFSKKKYPGQTTWATVPTILPDSGDVSHHPFSNEADHLVECIHRDVESHCNVADAFKTHEICFAADRSAAEGKPVSL